MKTQFGHEMLPCLLCGGESAGLFLLSSTRAGKPEIGAHYCCAACAAARDAPRAPRQQAEPSAVTAGSYLARAKRLKNRA